MTAKLIGDQAVIATMMELGRTLGNQAMNASMNKGATVLKKGAKDEYKRSGAWGVADSWGPATDTGMHLGENIKVEKVKGRPQGNIKLKIGPSGKRATAIAHLVEYGTATHWQPKRKWQHPGAKANPVLRKNFEGKKEEVSTLVTNDLKVQVERGVLKAKARNKTR
jgi:HK97 gp10 family phage protein